MSSSCYATPVLRKGLERAVDMSFSERNDEMFEGLQSAGKKVLKVIQKATPRELQSIRS